MCVIFFFVFGGVADVKGKQEPLDLYVSGSGSQEETDTFLRQNQNRLWKMISGKVEAGGAFLC